MTRVIVTGGRWYGDTDAIRRELTWVQQKYPDAVIVHGACKRWTFTEGRWRGADHLADVIAKELGLSTEPHPADWNHYGSGAGVIRNDEMVKAGAVLVLAFPGGHGTGDCIRRAKRAGITVKECGWRFE